MTATTRAHADELVRSGELMHRTVNIRAGAAAREFDAIGVPWDDVIEHWFGAETFDRDSVELATPTIVCWRHDEPVGLIIAGNSGDTGYEITGRLSDTVQGRDAATLLDDGVITRMSIGFEPIEYRVDEDDVIHWTRVRAREFSLVPFPAYDNAQITNIRQRPTKETQPMSDTATVTRDDLNTLNTGLDELRRELATLNAGTRGVAGPHLAPTIRSMGDFILAIASGDESATEFYRAYTGGVLDDAALNDTFVGDFIKLVTARRHFVSMFTTGTLPAQGNSIDYRQLATNTITVSNQANEGDDLAGPGKITLRRANAPVNTDGGWFQLSLQEILRGTGVELTTSWEAAAIAYAKYTDQRVKNTFLARINTILAADATDDTAALDLGAAATADQWLDLLLDAVETYDDRGFALGGLAASKTVFASLMHLKDGDRRLMNVFGNGVNQVGEINLPGLEGSIARISVRMMPKVAGNVAAFYDPVAIKFLEAPGSPARLQDENIINLTKAFSLYGFNAVLEPFPGAILPIEFGA